MKKKIGTILGILLLIGGIVWMNQRIEIGRPGSWGDFHAEYKSYIDGWSQKPGELYFQYKPCGVRLLAEGTLVSGTLVFEAVDDQGNVLYSQTIDQPGEYKIDKYLTYSGECMAWGEQHPEGTIGSGSEHLVIYIYRWRMYFDTPRF